MDCYHKHGNQEIVNVLATYYSEARTRNKKYSWRSFAKHLKISHGVLWDIVQRKRPVTIKMELRLTENLKAHNPGFFTTII